MKGILFAGFLMMGVSGFAAPAANFVPAFTGGVTQTLSVCRNAGAMSMDSRLAVIDSDAGQTETWSVVMAPAHGTLAGFDATMLSTGGVVNPSGLIYAPATGYTGADTFVIQVSDGINSSTTSVFVTVHGIPTLSSTLTPGAVCDQTTFFYTPSSGTPGAAFAWHRGTVAGIANAAASGSGGISESLFNITNDDQLVVYTYTVTASGCSSTQNVTLTVHPTPRLLSKLNDTTCTGGMYNYTPVPTMAGTTFTWSRAAVAGISPATSTGTGDIHETLTSSASSPVTVIYAFSLSAGGCTSSRNLAVAVVPQPPLTTIAISSAANVCSGILYQNFGAGIPPPPGTSYMWSAVNGEIWATGSTQQYCLVSFHNPGAASVTLTVITGGAQCATGNTYNVNVGAAESAGATVLYKNAQFIYLDNTCDSYQWGYDDASTLAPTVLAGATFQSYVNAAPDFLHNDYWVITTKNGCLQKTYYNRPVAIGGIPTAQNAELTVYPNPAGTEVTIGVPVGTEHTIAIVNLLGQVVKTKTSADKDVRFDIADMPAGCYFVSCYQNGLRTGTSKLVKE